MWGGPSSSTVLCSQKGPEVWAITATWLIAAPTPLGSPAAYLSRSRSKELSRRASSGSLCLQKRKKEEESQKTREYGRNRREGRGSSRLERGLASQAVSRPFSCNRSLTPIQVAGVGGGDVQLILLRLDRTPPLRVRLLLREGEGGGRPFAA